MTVAEALKKIETEHLLTAATEIIDDDIPKNEKIRDYYVEVPQLGNRQYPPKYLVKKAYGIAEKTNDISVLNQMNSVEARKRISQVNFGIIKQLDEAAIAQRENLYTIENKNLTTMNALNTILYGPPGTGKTYYTVAKAIEIIDKEFYKKNSNNRNELKKRFEDLLISDFDKNEGQIAFCTFHQSMAYEDFIEGIKPNLNGLEDELLKYKIKDGIFKNISRMATDALEIKNTIVEDSEFSLSEEEFNKAVFYKMSLGNTQNSKDDEIFDYCIKNSCVALGWGGNIDYKGMDYNQVYKKAKESAQSDFSARQVNMFIHFIKRGNYIVISQGNHRFRAIGKIIGDYEYNPNAGIEYLHFRKVAWLLKNKNLPVSEIYNLNFQQKTLYKLNSNEIKQDFFIKPASPNKKEEKLKNFVLIIDKINRGNVSQIFGELITLIEDDKRQGCAEALSVILPYSKESFTVPPNLYIVGTMNTADRSVEALDTALRRRFVFEEKSPKPNLLNTERLLWEFFWKYEKDKWVDKKFQEIENDVYDFFGVDETFKNEKINIWGKMEKKGKLEDQILLFEEHTFTGINLELMLDTINNRLKTILSKDHTIGHAWLMNVYTLQELGLAFKNKILPLLQEFFYNDYAKIGLILGEAFVGQKKNGKKIFANFKDDNELASDYEDKINYTLSDPMTLPIADFTTIYS